MNMLCREIMKREVEAVTTSDSVLEAARKMRDHGIGILPVCDESRQVLGVLTDRDIAIRVCAAGGLPDAILVGDVMSRGVVACRAEDDLRTAEDLMSNHRKSRILVTDGQGRLCGIISLSDIAEREEAQRAAETLRAVAAREARQGEPAAHRGGQAPAIQ
jgi:CBS domain-containing protein